MVVVFDWGEWTRPIKRTKKERRTKVVDQVNKL